MSFYIDSRECVNCPLCERICPVDAIKELDCVRWIDPDICTNCNLCPEVCPVDCIFDEAKTPKPDWLV